MQWAGSVARSGLDPLRVVAGSVARSGLDPLSVVSWLARSLPEQVLTGGRKFRMGFYVLWLKFFQVGAAVPLFAVPLIGCSYIGGCLS